MEYHIEVKNVAPIRVLTTKKEVHYSNLTNSITDIVKLAGKMKNGNHITLVYQPEQKLEAMTRPCCPVSTAFSPIDETEYQFEVLPRMSVVSAIHRGEYENFDETMEILSNYIKEHNLKSSLPVRVIHHRGGQIYKLFKPKSKDYVAEVQIPIVES